MQLGMVGLGRMGASMVRRLMRGGHECAVCDLSEDAVDALAAGRVSDSGEGRWTIEAAIDEGVPVPVLSAALYARFSSRGEAESADKLLSAMRLEFGGHVEKESGP